MGEMPIAVFFAVNHDFDDMVTFLFQAVRAFLNGQSGVIWPINVGGVVIALWTNIIEINVNIVDWKNASKWGWEEKV